MNRDDHSPEELSRVAQEISDVARALAQQTAYEQRGQLQYIALQAMRLSVHLGQIRDWTEKEDDE